MAPYSVLMSVYKKENPSYFEAALLSMLNQTQKPAEIVLVEDGALTDALYAVIEKYKGVLHLVINRENMGLGPALNRGLLVCSNELVARMDTDDISIPERCEKQLRLFENNGDLDLCGGDIAEFIGTEDNVVAKRRVPVDDESIKRYMQTRCALNHMTVMFKKSAVISSGNYQEWFWNEDYYLWIRMMQNNCVFANTGDVLVYVRTGEDMYARRGGRAYYMSEKRLQRYMLDNKLISKTVYAKNVGKRFILQRLLPNKLRGWVYRRFARG